MILLSLAFLLGALFIPRFTLLIFVAVTIGVWVAVARWVAGWVQRRVGQSKNFQ